MKASWVDVEDTQHSLVIRPVRGFLRRARGLVGHAPPPPGEAWHFERCNCVHGFGMAYPIDVLFLDGDFVVVSIDLLRPWRACRAGRARSVLEMRAGEARRLGVRTGTNLRQSFAAKHSIA